MRTITSHQINECNSNIAITADEVEPANGASHNYDLTVARADGEEWVGNNCYIRFQRGPIQEVGTNGITHEALLAILIDRLEGFQSGPYACDENAEALAHINVARQFLQARTLKRVARGVEGTHVV